MTRVGVTQDFRVRIAVSWQIVSTLETVADMVLAYKRILAEILLAGALIRIILVITRLVLCSVVVRPAQILA